jgi:hypothetical protein
MKPIEREFLQLATWWLGCRWAVMTGRDIVQRNGTLPGRLLGMIDAAAEMRELVREERA